MKLLKFNEDMADLVLSFNKTQTRRPIKDDYRFDNYDGSCSVMDKYGD